MSELNLIIKSELWTLHWVLFSFY